jgi:hypothetical protein
MQPSQNITITIGKWMFDVIHDSVSIMLTFQGFAPPNAEEMYPEPDFSYGAHGERDPDDPGPVWAGNSDDESCYQCDRCSATVPEGEGWYLPYFDDEQRVCRECYWNSGNKGEDIDKEPDPARRNRRWTKEEDMTLIAMWMQGKCLEEIADAVNRTRDGVHQRSMILRNIKGVPLPKKKRGWEEQRKTIAFRQAHGVM